MQRVPSLPEFPKVLLDGSALVIQYENGEKEVWGYEPNQNLASEIAFDIELGLRSIKFVSLELMKHLNNLGDQLSAFGVQDNYINEYVFEGYCRLNKWFMELESNHREVSPDTQ